MLSLTEIFQEASEETDKKYRSEAISFWNKLISYIKTRPEDFMQKTRSVSKGEFKGAIDFPAKEVDKNHNKLRILFAQERGNTKGGFHVAELNDQRIPVIYLFVLKPNTYYEQDDILQAIKNQRQFFVHEFIHYMDSMRWKGNNAKDFLSYSRGFQKKNKDEKTYYNNAMEVNAYYQEAISQYMRYLSKEVKKQSTNIKALIPDTAQKFIKLVKTTFFQQDFIANLTSENMKKIDKRLFNVYQRIKHVRN